MTDGCYNFIQQLSPTWMFDKARYAFLLIPKNSALSSNRPSEMFFTPFPTPICFPHPIMNMVRPQDLQPLPRCSKQWKSLTEKHFFSIPLWWLCASVSGSMLLPQDLLMSSTVIKLSQICKKFLSWRMRTCNIWVWGEHYRMMNYMSIIKEFIPQL